MTTSIRKRLTDLLGTLEVTIARDVWVNDLVLNSRQVKPGCAYVALRGHEQHGLDFCQDAVDAGASVVLWDPATTAAAPTLPADVQGVAVPDLAQHLSLLAGRFFGEPSQSVKVIGVTGTNGKTTVAHLIAHGYHLLGKSAGFIGTIGMGKVGELLPNPLTTPDAVEVQRQLASLRDRGVQVIAMEVSSHALAQHRVAAVQFHSAVFTNLTQDHLDYHHSLEAYAEAKFKLFTEHALDRALINLSDPWGQTLWQTLNRQSQNAIELTGVTQLGQTHERSMVPTAVVTERSGTRIEFVSPWGSDVLPTHLLGDFNVTNVLSALGVMLMDAVPMQEALRALSQVASPPGRMELFGGTDAPLVVVDYAHTPDALEKALHSLKRIRQGELWCVFGCGGDRDQTKRSSMGEIAKRFADHVVVTSDNPRNEDPAGIVDDILSGMPTRTHVLVELDRRQAIYQAVHGAGKNDTILVAGKGHEDYQIIGRRMLPLSDRFEVTHYLEQEHAVTQIG